MVHRMCDSHATTKITDFEETAVIIDAAEFSEKTGLSQKTRGAFYKGRSETGFDAWVKHEKDGTVSIQLYTGPLRGDISMSLEASPVDDVYDVEIVDNRPDSADDEPGSFEALVEILGTVTLEVGDQR
jgi:hypothetical protein